MINKVLFIGNFLSHTSGSYSVSEFIADKLCEDEKISVLKAANSPNRLIRLLHIFYFSLFKYYSLLHIDVFSGNSFLFARMASAIGKIRGKKVVLTLHGGALHEYYVGRDKIFKRLFNNAYVQSPSLFLKNFFENKNHHVVYCPNPFLLKNFPYQRSVLNPCSILWVRAFTPIYNPEVVVSVLHNVLKTFPEATLTMIGPDKGTLYKTQELIGELGLTSRVSILGPVNNNDLHKYYQSHSVYLNTTSYESFGVAVVEAASCGVPIVSFSVGEIPYLWTDEENILLCDLCDVDKMAVQVKRILSDSNLSIRLSTNARKRAEDFSWDKIKNHWIELVTK